MKVGVLSPEEWSVLADDAHAICFGEANPVKTESLSFALLVSDDQNNAVAYMTCRETDAETVYMQFGGAFPGSKDTFKSFKAYQAMIDKLSEKYTRASTLIENTNTPMLKFAMKAGLLISGVRYFKGSILLEHYIEWEKN